MSEYIFTHLPEQNRFELEVDNKISFIDYEDRSGTLYLVHSEVPREMRGQGVGKKLVTKTLDYLSDHDIKAIPVCRYIKLIASRYNVKEK